MSRLMHDGVEYVSTDEIHFEEWVKTVQWPATSNMNEILKFAFLAGWHEGTKLEREIRAAIQREDAE